MSLKIEGNENETVPFFAKRDTSPVSNAIFKGLKLLDPEFEQQKTVSNQFLQPVKNVAMEVSTSV
ncbi:hypothetical protein HUJ05_008114 [Dendroctonus ponderosae]|nr:hypothetical protein HUJ05_008114 [Dendroctonus ponderosae]